jgi:hypothetical protein
MPGTQARECLARRNGRRLAKIAGSIVLSTMSVAWFGGCSPGATTPMRQPEEVMKAAWGPFARQCTSMRTSHFAAAGRSGVREVGTDHESCIGFAATPASGGAMEITGSTTSDGSTSDAGPSTPIVFRILRAPGGVSRPAASGDTGLLAQGSDDEHLAEAFAAQIGLTQKQVIDPKTTLRLPIFLDAPSPLEGMLQCRPDGGSVDRGRETLLFSCTLDERVRTDRLDARVQLAGVEEVDVLSGVRLSGSFAGSLSGRQRVSAADPGQRIDYHIWYERTTELE